MPTNTLPRFLPRSTHGWRLTMPCVVQYENFAPTERAAFRNATVAAPGNAPTTTPLPAACCAYGARSEADTGTRMIFGAGRLFVAATCLIRLMIGIVAGVSAATT